MPLPGARDAPHQLHICITAVSQKFHKPCIEHFYWRSQTLFQHGICKLFGPRTLNLRVGQRLNAWVDAHQRSFGKPLHGVDGGWTANLHQHVLLIKYYCYNKWFHNDNSKIDMYRHNHNVFADAQSSHPDPKYSRHSIYNFYNRYIHHRMPIANDFYIWHSHIYSDQCDYNHNYRWGRMSKPILTLI